MLGLERVYDDLDQVRRRIARLGEMDRIPRKSKDELLVPLFQMMKVVNNLIEEGADGGSESNQG